MKATSVDYERTAGIYSDMSLGKCGTLRHEFMTKMHSYDTVGAGPPGSLCCQQYLHYESTRFRRIPRLSFQSLPFSFPFSAFAPALPLPLSLADACVALANWADIAAEDA